MSKKEKNKPILDKRNDIISPFDCISLDVLSKEVIGLKIIVHYPQTQKKQSEFDAHVAKFHAEYVAQYIEKLNCSTDQKLELVDAVAKTVLQELKK